MKLVVLDRDGTINFDSPEYIRSAAALEPIPGSLDAIARLNRAGFTVAVATNQSGLARGYFDHASLDAMHDKLNALLAPLGGRIDRFEVCPHHPDYGCNCRKPRPGLLDALARHYKVSMEGVPVIGDSRRDLEAARAVGARPILVRTGNGDDAAAALGHHVEEYADLAAATTALIEGRAAGEAGRGAR